MAIWFREEKASDSCGSFDGNQAAPILSCVTTWLVIMIVKAAPHFLYLILLHKFELCRPRSLKSMALIG